jgi:hypothetical protein
LETGRPLRGADCINDALRKSFLDAGALSHDQVYPPDVRMSPVRWYCLRKRTQTIMEDNTDGSGIALNWVDVLLSHKPRARRQVITVGQRCRCCGMRTRRRCIAS